MKKLIQILVFFTLSLANRVSIAATTVPAGTLSSAHWTLSGSPYNITGHIIVANGDSLVIDPGVVVEFQGKYKLFCNGKITANGTASQRIVFTVPVANRSTGWLGIRYDNTPTTNGQSSYKYCTFEYGRADLTGDNQGGAMYFNKFSNCIISNSVFQNCYATNGAAIYCEYASPTILQDSFYNNTSSSGGPCLELWRSSSNIDSCLFRDGGITCYYSSLKISNSYFKKCLGGAGVSSYSDPAIGYLEITHNVFDSCRQSGGSGGGGVLLCNAQARIEHNIFKNNLSSCGGGAISCWTQYVYSNSSSVVISNNLFYGNRSRISMGAGAPFGGGAIYFSNCSGKVINNTIVNNHSDSTGGAIFCSEKSSPSFYNNIIWGNTTDDAPENVFILDNTSDPNFYNNDIQGGYSGINTNGTPLVSANVNNIDSLPNFTSPSTGMYTLNTGSPCIDKGDTVTIKAKIPAKDLGGAVRIMGAKIDMGSYESLGYLPCDSPANIHIGTVTGHTAIISWDTVAGVSGYEYYVALHPSTPPGVGTSTTAHSILISSLSLNTKYDFCVRTVCSTKTSGWICDTFTTTSGAGIPQTTINQIVSVHPNPGTGLFTIDMPYGSTSGEVIITNMYGQVVAKKSVTNADWKLDLRTAAKGIYMIQVKCGDDTYRAKAVLQ